MIIRKVQPSDIDRILDLLSQVLEVHAKIRPDLFAFGTTKYDREQLEDMLSDDKKPIFVALLNDGVVGYAFCQERMPIDEFHPRQNLSFR